MTFLAATRVSYSARIARAELLRSRFAFASEILTFYKEVATFQKQSYERLPKTWGKRPIVPAAGSIRSEMNLPPLVGSFADFLSMIRNSAPAPLAAEALKHLSDGKSKWETLLEQFWKAGLQETSSASSANQLQEFLCRAFLQPYAEFVGGAMLPPNLAMTVCRCPRCDSLPVIGVLRPEGDGAKRFLQCAWCSQEWEFRRILCASCGEEREDRLPVYVSEQFPYIRVESCLTCQRHLRSIDLTKDGNAVPVVDDLSAIPLTFWAQEQGLRRIQSNLLGT